MENLERLQTDYRTLGIAVVRDPGIPEGLIADARAAVNELAAGRYETGIPPLAVRSGTGALLKIDNSHPSNRAIGALAGSSEVGRAVAAVTGSNRVQVWATQLLVKPTTEESGANVGWHQDRQYWSYWDTQEGLFTAWIALDEVGPDSGPVRFVEGSHRWGFLDSGDFFGTDNDSIREGIRVPSGEEWRERVATLPAGGLSIHHSLTYHGSGPNRSDRPRLSLVLHMRNEIPKPVPGDSSYYVSHLDKELFAPVIFGAG